MLIGSPGRGDSEANHVSGMQTGRHAVDVPASIQGLEQTFCELVGSTEAEHHHALIHNYIIWVVKAPTFLEPFSKHLI